MRTWSWPREEHAYSTDVGRFSSGRPSRPLSRWRRRARRPYKSARLTRGRWAERSVGSAGVKNGYRPGAERIKWVPGGGVSS